MESCTVSSDEFLGRVRHIYMYDTAPANQSLGMHNHAFLVIHVYMYNVSLLHHLSPQKPNSHLCPPINKGELNNMHKTHRVFRVESSL